MTGGKRSGRRGCAAAVLLLVALLGSGCAKAYSDAYAPAVAVVNGSTISEKELIGRLRLRLPRIEADLKGQGDGRAARYLDFERSIIEGLIAVELLAGHAAKLDVTVSDADIDKGVAQTRAQFDSEEKFVAALKIFGLTPDALREQVRKGTLAEKVQAEVAKGAIPEEELLAAYNELKHVFDVQFRAAHILVCSNLDRESGLCREESAEDDNLAAVLSKRARDGADFAALARNFSVDKGSAASGGDLGWLSQADVIPQFGTAIPRLQPGGISDPVRTPAGVHVIKLIARGRTFEDAKDDIAQAIGRDRQREAVDAFINKALSDASIHVNPRYGRFDRVAKRVVPSHKILPDERDEPAAR